MFKTSFLALALVLIFLTCSLVAQPPQRNHKGVPLQTRPNIHGGQSFYYGGRYVGQSRQNVFQSYNFYSTKGYVAGGRPNIFGGTNYPSHYGIYKQDKK